MELRSNRRGRLRLLGLDRRRLNAQPVFPFLIFLRLLRLFFLGGFLDGRRFGGSRFRSFLRNNLFFQLGKGSQQFGGLEGLNYECIRKNFFCFVRLTAPILY